MDEREVGLHPFEPCVLGLEVLDAAELIGAHAAVLGLSGVERGLVDGEVAADVADLLTSLLATKGSDDLGLAESGFPHGSKVGWSLYFQVGREWGSLQLKTQRGLTPYDFVCREWQRGPDRFVRDPPQDPPEPYKRSLE